MELTKYYTDKIENFLNSLNCSEVDIPYYVDAENIDFTDAYDSIYNMIDESQGFNIDIIYYSNAIKYLQENDPSLKESFEIAEEFGYEVGNLSSETLASLLASQNAQIEFSELQDEIEQFFEELQEEIEADEEEEE